jgi:hypothetical protein
MGTSLSAPPRAALDGRSLAVLPITNRVLDPGSRVCPNTLSRSSKGLHMDGERQCPACGNGQGLARRVSTVAGQKGIVIVVMVCEACSHEWSTERSSPTIEPLPPAQPTKPH